MRWSVIQYHLHFFCSQRSTKMAIRAQLLFLCLFLVFASSCYARNTMFLSGMFCIPLYRFILKITSRKHTTRHNSSTTYWSCKISCVDGDLCMLFNLTLLNCDSQLGTRLHFSDLLCGEYGNIL